MNDKTNIEVNGVVIRNVRRMESKFAGVDSLTLERFPRGTVIAFKALRDLTAQESSAIFGNNPKKYSLSVVWRENKTYASKVKAEVKAPEQKEFEPSKYQRDILEFFLGSTEHMVVEALAGSGKTSTMVWLLRKAAKAGMTKAMSIITMAFNSNIRDELNVQLAGTGVNAVTTHQFGFSIVREQFNRKIRLNDKKDFFAYRDILCSRSGLEPEKESYKAIRKTPEYRIWSVVKQVVGLTKNTAILPDVKNGTYSFGAEKRKQISELIDQYEITWDEKVERAYVIDLAVELIKTSLPDSEGEIRQITYDDMLYLPLALNLVFPRYDVVIVDEAQDLNKCQITFLTKCITEAGRVVTVGDRNQSIYKFRGADSQAIDRICQVLSEVGNIHKFELPINYRSDKQIIKFAQRLVPNLQGFNQAEGVAACISFEDAINRSNNDRVDIELNDGVDFAPRKLEDCSFCFICRTNVPLVITVYELIKSGKRARVLGRTQIALPMINLIRDLCSIESDGSGGIDHIANDVSENGVIYDGLLTRLDDYERMQLRKLQDEGYEHKAEEVQQTCECIRVIASKVTSNKVSDVLEEIDKLFVDDEQDDVITLSTGHRSKGKEWNVVFVLRPDQLPHSLAKPNPDGSWSEDQQQEKNLQYVIDTRARNRLYYVQDWPFGTNKALSFNGPGDAVEGKQSPEPPAPELESPKVAELVNSRQFVDDGEPF